MIENGNYLKGFRGVGFYIKNKNVMMVIIGVYAPASDAELEDFEKFYVILQNTLTRECKYYTVLMGDWNSKIGLVEAGNTNIGPYGYGQSNKNPEYLIEFIKNNNLKLADSYLKKKNE